MFVEHDDRHVARALGVATECRDGTAAAAAASLKPEHERRDLVVWHRGAGAAAVPEGRERLHGRSDLGDLAAGTTESIDVEPGCRRTSRRDRRAKRAHHRARRLVRRGRRRGTLVEKEVGQDTVGS